MIEMIRSENGSCTNSLNLTIPTRSVTATSVLLLWDRPDQWERIEGYDIYCNGQWIENSTRLCYIAKDLNAGTDYEFQVKVRSSEGKDNQDEISACIRVRTKDCGEFFNIRDFGAVGDGQTRDTQAIRKAIGECSEDGTVVIPAGIYYTDQLVLKSNMTLYLEKGATLSFVRRDEQEDYPVRDIQLPGPEGEVPYSSQGLITACGQKNITIMGEGNIHGNGEVWWPKATGYTGKRPYSLELVQCANILVQGISIIDSPCWTVHPLYCDDAIFADVKILKLADVHANNGDGINPDSSRNVLIAGCTFANQDDCIAVKAGKRKEENGYRPQRSCEHIVIRDCLMDKNLGKGATNGIAMGSEMSGGIRHVTVQNCILKDSKYVSHIKTQRGRGGAIEDICFKNIVYHSTIEFQNKVLPTAPISINMFYYREVSDEAQEVTPTTPVFRNIRYQDVEISCVVDQPLYIIGLPEMPIEDVVFENVSIKAKGDAFIHNIKDLITNNFMINDKYFE